MLDPTYDARREATYEALRDALRAVPARWNDEWLFAEILGEMQGCIGVTALDHDVCITYSLDEFLIIDAVCLCQVRQAIGDLVDHDATAHEWLAMMGHGLRVPGDLGEYLYDGVAPHACGRES